MSRCLVDFWVAGDQLFGTSGAVAESSVDARVSGDVPRGMSAKRTLLGEFDRLRRSPREFSRKSRLAISKKHPSKHIPYTIAVTWDPKIKKYVTYRPIIYINIYNAESNK